MNEEESTAEVTKLGSLRWRYRVVAPYGERGSRHTWKGSAITRRSAIRNARRILFNQIGNNNIKIVECPNNQEAND